MTRKRGLGFFAIGLGMTFAGACSDSGTAQVGGAVDAGVDVAIDAQDAAADQTGDETPAAGITLLSPVEDITTLAGAQNPPFRWSKEAFDKYELTIEKKSGGTWGTHFTKKDTAATFCPADECSVKTGLDFYLGKYRWRVTNGPATVTSDTLTFESTVADPAKGDFDVIGPEETIGRGAKTPQMAVDPTGAPHVVAYHKDGADNQYALRMYDKTTDGSWREWIVARTEFGASAGNATGLDASRIYIPDIVVDSQGRGWVLARVASQADEGGSLLGHSVWLIDALKSSSPQIAGYKYFPRDGNYGRQGNLALDPFQPGFVFMTVGSKASQARWYKLDSGLNQVDVGDIPMGSTGEKFRFEISPREGKQGVFHLVGLGDTQFPNVYQSSVWAAGGGDSVPWLPIGEFGSDFTHPSIGIDSSNPLIAYLGVQTSISDNGVRINIWDGTKMLFDLAAAPKFDGPAAEDPNGNGEGRFGPQWAPALGGGAFLCWTSPAGTIKVRYVKPSPNVNDFGPIVEVANGVQCTLATDATGDLHLVYGSGADLKYRKIVTK